jgi:hypothetical protein
MTDTQCQVVVPDWSHTPQLGDHDDLVWGLMTLQRLTAQFPPATVMDEFTRAIERHFPADHTLRLAVWARCKALLLFQGLEGTKESDRLRREQWSVEAAIGLPVDPAYWQYLLGMARVWRAAVHPLGRDGRFMPGFSDSCDRLHRRMVRNNAGVRSLN